MAAPPPIVKAGSKRKNHAVCADISAGGRTEEQKRAVIRKSQALVGARCAEKFSMRVWIHDMPKENWGIAGTSARTSAADHRRHQPAFRPGGARTQQVLHVRRVARALCAGEPSSMGWALALRTAGSGKAPGWRDLLRLETIGRINQRLTAQCLTDQRDHGLGRCDRLPTLFLTLPSSSR